MLIFFEVKTIFICGYLAGARVERKWNRQQTEQPEQEMDKNHGNELPAMTETARQRDSIVHPTLQTEDERSIIGDSRYLGSPDVDDNAADNHHHRRWESLQPGAISNLCSATLGAGALSLPFAISLTGIVVGVLLLMFSAYLTIISVDVIIDACVRTRLFKYEDVAERLVGRRAGRLLEASLLIFCFGVRS